MCERHECAWRWGRHPSFSHFIMRRNGQLKDGSEPGRISPSRLETAKPKRSRIRLGNRNGLHLGCLSPAYDRGKFPTRQNTVRLMFSLIMRAEPSQSAQPMLPGWKL